MDGEIQGRLYARNDDELAKAKKMGYDMDKVLTHTDLVNSQDVFFALTGITDGELVHGVKYFGSGATTHSLVMRAKSGTVREIRAQHRWEKLMEISQIEYDITKPGQTG